MRTSDGRPLVDLPAASYTPMAMIMMPMMFSIPARNGSASITPNSITRPIRKPDTVGSVSLESVPALREAPSGADDTGPATDVAVDASAGVDSLLAAR